MGANLSCPQGFEDGLMFTCVAQCPPEFKRVQEQGGAGGPPLVKCVHISRNRLSFPLNPLPKVENGKPIPKSFEEETTRIAGERQRIKNRVASEEELQDSVKTQTQEYSRIQSEYAAYKGANESAFAIKEVKDSLKPFRPPTAPSSDLETERQAILALHNRNLYFVQVALFLVVMVMISYMVLPLDTANTAALALLCVGVAMGFFLRR